MTPQVIPTISPVIEAALVGIPKIFREDVTIALCFEQIVVMVLQPIKE